MYKHHVFRAIILSLCVVVGVFFGKYTPTLQAVSTPRGIAEQELSKWLNTIREDYQSYGFKSQDELDKAVLGNPYTVYTLDPLVVQNYQNGQRVAALARNQQQWEFPVLVQSEAGGILRVAYFENRWQVVEFGGLSYGKKLFDLHQHLLDSPSSTRLVTFHPTSSTFALVERNGKESLIHLGSYIGLFPNLDRDHFTEYTPDEVLPQIKATYAELEHAAKEK